MWRKKMPMRTNEAVGWIPHLHSPFQLPFPHLRNSFFNLPPRLHPCLHFCFLPLSRSELPEEKYASANVPRTAGKLSYFLSILLGSLRLARPCKKVAAQTWALCASTPSLPLVWFVFEPSVEPPGCAPFREKGWEKEKTLIMAAK